MERLDLNDTLIETITPNVNYKLDDTCLIVKRTINSHNKSVIHVYNKEEQELAQLLVYYGYVYIFNTGFRKVHISNELLVYECLVCLLKEGYIIRGYYFGQGSLDMYDLVYGELYRVASEYENDKVRKVV